MATQEHKITNLTNGTLEIGFRKEPLGVRCSDIFRGPLPEDIKYFRSYGKVSVITTEIQDTPAKQTSPAKAKPDYKNQTAEKNKPDSTQG